MELEYAILADRADFTSDGALVLFGGDLDSIAVSEFPQIVQATLVVRLLLDPEEEPTGHTFGLHCTDAHGKHTPIVENRPIRTGRNLDEPDQPSGTRLILGLTFVAAAAGLHVFHLLVDGCEVKRIRLRVKHASKQDAEVK